VAILEIEEFDTEKKALSIPFVSGSNMASWLPTVFPELKLLAKELGCTHIRGCGRPGWAKALPELKQIRTVYECEV
jgi:hypothetical protein